jgi:hypothetical protein
MTPEQEIETCGEYEVHPAASLFPLMTDAEIDALAEDMAANGQREPIILFRGQILDGRNRLLACARKGIAPKFHNELPADPYVYAASVNLHRRHLDASQRAMIAAKLATMRKGRPSENAPQEAFSQTEAAILMQSSRSGVQRAHFVRENGVPALVEAVEQRLVTVATAAEFAKSASPMQQAVLISKHGSVARAVKATVPAKADRAADKVVALRTPKSAAFIAPEAAGYRYEARAAVGPARRAFIEAIMAADLSVSERVNEVRAVMTATGLQPDFGIIKVSNFDTKH